MFMGYPASATYVQVLHNRQGHSEAISTFTTVNTHLLFIVLCVEDGWRMAMGMAQYPLISLPLHSQFQSLLTLVSMSAMMMNYIK